MKKILLFTVAVAFTRLVSAQCTDLFISEYDEGSVNNKAIEIYNPTASSISLTGYTINRYSNGSATITETMPLTGSIASYDVVVITNGQTDSVWVTGSPGYWSYGVSPTLYAMGDLHSTGLYGTGTDPFYFNGNDAVTLEKTGGVIVDIFGKVGENPGLGWGPFGTNQYWTVDHSLVRKATVKQGVTANPATFDPTVQYDSLPKNTWTNLGIHTCDCKPAAVNEIKKIDNFFLFPNPVTNNNFTIKATDFISSVEIYDVLGNIIFQRITNNQRGDLYVELDHASKGIYFVKVRLHDNNIVTKKISVN